MKKNKVIKQNVQFEELSKSEKRLIVGGNLSTGGTVVKNFLAWLYPLIP